jgi:hypothetical protein
MERFLSSYYHAKYFTNIMSFNNQWLYYITYIGAIITHIAEIRKKRLKTC